MKEFFKKRRSKYIIVFIVLVIFYAAMVTKPATTMLFGEEIWIKTVAFDPRDVFRGDYIQLFYDINEISIDKVDKEIIELLKYDAYSLNGKEVFVVLSESEKYFDVEKVTHKKPGGELYIKGQFSYISRNGSDNIETIFVEYPLDKFFVPENTGKELEDKVRKGEAYAVIKLFNGYPLLLDVVAEEN